MTGLPDERDPSGRFVRGLTLGALLGAVIAGSSIWTRARARRRLASREAVAMVPAPDQGLAAPATPVSADVSPEGPAPGADR